MISTPRLYTKRQKLVVPPARSDASTPSHPPDRFSHKSKERRTAMPPSSLTQGAMRHWCFMTPRQWLDTQFLQLLAAQLRRVGSPGAPRNHQLFPHSLAPPHSSCKSKRPYGATRLGAHSHSAKGLYAPHPQAASCTMAIRRRLSKNHTPPHSHSSTQIIPERQGLRRRHPGPPLAA